MSTKTDSLGLQRVGNTAGKDVACVWDYFWMLYDKTNNQTLYCFGVNINGILYEDGDVLNEFTMKRFSLSVDQMKRIFFDPNTCAANGFDHKSNSWLQKFNGTTMNTFLHKHKPSCVVYQTTTAVIIPNTLRYEHGTFTGLETIYVPKDKSKKKSESSAKNQTTMTSTVDSNRQSSASSSTDLYSQGDTSGGTSESSNSTNRKSSSSSTEDSLVPQENSKDPFEFEATSGDEEGAVEEDKEQQRLARATVFKKVNVICKRRRQTYFTYGSIPIKGEGSPKFIDWKNFTKFHLTKPEKDNFEARKILVEGEQTDNSWYDHLSAKREDVVYFYNRYENNFTKLIETEISDSESGSDSSDSDSEEESDLNNWASTVFSSVCDFNLCWYWNTFTRPSLIFGITPVTHQNAVLNVDNVKIDIVELSAERLAEIEQLPIIVDKNQRGKKWTTYLYEKRNNYFWFFNRHDGTIVRTNTSCRFRGGFLTRNQAATNGIKVSTITEMNDVGKCFEHKDWPRERISGDYGFCAPIAAHAICSDLSVKVIELLKTQFHEKLAINESSSVFVTDGTYNIVDVMNRKMSSTILRQIYPSADLTSIQGFSNVIFGDRDHCGKFLIELRDEIVQSAIGISHYVSMDTEKLEIYDPMSKNGAIVTQRSIDGNCLFLETLQLNHSVKVFHVWKLFQKSKRLSSSTLSTEEIDEMVVKNKKRRGKKQHKFYATKKINEAPL